MIISIHQSTTETTVFIFSADGEVISRTSNPLPQIYPRSGWVEQDADHIWQITLDTIRQALASSKLDAEQIHSIGIANQRETCLLWNKYTGEPVHNAIVWQCRRSMDICLELKPKEQELDIHNKTGLQFDPYFSVSKILWLFQQYPDIKRQADQGDLLFGTIDTWLIWKLTGGQSHVTDHTNASRTLMYNIHGKKWDLALLTFYGINPNILPKIQASSSYFGDTQPGLISHLSFPIHGVAGNQQAALFGQGCTNAGMVKNTYSTGCFMLMYTANRAVITQQGLLTTIACNRLGKPAYALEGSVFNAGAAVQWLKDEMQLINDPDETSAIATSINDNGGVYMVPAFTGLGAPYWNPEARGTLVGLTRNTGKKHLVRATLEAIAYQTKDILNLMIHSTGEPISQLKVNGAASANDFLMQFQADILDVELIRPNNLDSTAIGAAILAGLASGFWQADHLPSNFIQIERRFTAQIDRFCRKNLYRGWLAAIDQSLKEISECSSQL